MGERAWGHLKIGVVGALVMAGKLFDGDDPPFVVHDADLFDVVPRGKGCLFGRRWVEVDKDLMVAV